MSSPVANEKTKHLWEAMYLIHDLVDAHLRPAFFAPVDWREKVAKSDLVDALKTVRRTAAIATRGTRAPRRKPACIGHNTRGWCKKCKS